jgi:hypothetical protein
MSEKPLTEGRRKVLQKLNALPDNRRRAARRMIVVVLASFGIVAASFAGIVVYWIWSAPNPNWTVLAVWLGATILFAMVGITFVSARFAKALGLPLRDPGPPDPPLR